MTFEHITKDEIASILNTAMDDGEWHTPSAYDIQLHYLSNSRAAYGWCNISLHNTFNDKEVWFNINADSVSIWETVYEKGRANGERFWKINNIHKLSDALKKYQSPAKEGEKQTTNQ